MDYFIRIFSNVSYKLINNTQITNRHDLIFCLFIGGWTLKSHTKKKTQSFCNSFKPRIIVIMSDDINIIMIYTFTNKKNHNQIRMNTLITFGITKIYLRYGLVGSLFLLVKLKYD